MSKQGNWPQPTRPRLGARAAYRIAPALAPNRLYRRLAALLERIPLPRRLFTAGEEVGKQAIFGCRMCGQCALPVTGYACPMTCPKQLRNGPCGGVAPDGGCEVYPERRCVWLIAFERSSAAGRADDLRLLHRPIDQRRHGTSSWLNYWQGRDEDLWASARDGRPTILVSR